MELDTPMNDIEWVLEFQQLLSTKNGQAKLRKLYPHLSPMIALIPVDEDGY